MRLILVSLVTIGGCVATLPYDDASVTADLAVEVARVTVANRLKPEPKPVGDTCENCGGTGKVGDGRVFVKCPECDGTGKRKK